MKICHFVRSTGEDWIGSLTAASKTQINSFKASGLLRALSNTPICLTQAKTAEAQPPLNILARLISVTASHSGVSYIKAKMYLNPAVNNTASTQEIL